MNIFVEAGRLIDPLSNSGAETSTIAGFFKSILGTVMYIGVPIIGLIVIYAGFKFLTARGNSAKIRKATFNITWVIIGIAIFLGAWTLSSIVDSTINSISN